MKNIKMYDEFVNEKMKEERFPKRDLGRFVDPEEPIKRELTSEEQRFMLNNYPYHSFSSVDAKGRIILGGGESNRGRYCITEEDLAKFMNVYKNTNHQQGIKSPYK
jgi:hypothetical protein